MSLREPRRQAELCITFVIQDWHIAFVLQLSIYAYRGHCTCSLCKDCQQQYTYPFTKWLRFNLKTNYPKHSPHLQKAAYLALCLQAGEASVHFVTPQRAEFLNCVFLHKPKTVKEEPFSFLGLVNNSSEGNVCRIVEREAKFIADFY